MPSLKSLFFSFFILTVAALIVPIPGYCFNGLDIFYSNDVGGKTEPCG